MHTEGVKAYYTPASRGARRKHWNTTKTRIIYNLKKISPKMNFTLDIKTPFQIFVLKMEYRVAGGIMRNVRATNRLMPVSTLSAWSAGFVFFSTCLSSPLKTHLRYHVQKGSSMHTQSKISVPPLKNT